MKVKKEDGLSVWQKADIIGKYAVQLASVIAVLVALYNVRIGLESLELAYKQDARNERSQPILYETSFERSSMVYHIRTEDNREFELPVLSPRVRVLSGAIKRITAISFDGKKYGTISSLTMRPEWNSEYSVGVDVAPLEAPLVEEDIYYDNFYLYIEPVEGDPQLDLVCAKVDLLVKEVAETNVYTWLSLLKLDRDKIPRTAEERMLSAYWDLHTNIHALEEQIALLREQIGLH